MSKVREKWQKVPLTVKVSAAYAICSFLQKGLSFITLPLFTRLLTKAQYGQVTIYSSWKGILSILLTLNLAYGSFSTAMVKFDKDRDGYISSVEGICLALASVFLLIYLPFQVLWNQLFELPTFIICMIVAETLGTTAILLWNGKKRFEFKYKAVVAITLASAVISPIIQYLLVINSEEKGYARIVGASAVSILIGGFFFVFNLIKGRKMFRKEYWKYALGFNIPLLAYYFSEIIFNQSDRIMISHMVGTEEAAVYGVAYSLAMILTFVLTAINNSYVPWYYGKIKEGRMAENKGVSLGIAGLMAILLLGVIWFAPEIIRILAGKQYVEAVYVVPPVAISVLLLFYSQMFINVEFFFEEKKKLVFAAIGAAVTNLVLNWIFIKLFGYIAAAYTTLASYVLFALANYWAMKKVLAVKGIEDEGFSYKGLIGLFFGFVLIAYVGVFIYDFLIPRIIISAAVLAVVFLKRKVLVDLFKKIRTRQNASQADRVSQTNEEESSGGIE